MCRPPKTAAARAGPGRQAGGTRRAMPGTGAAQTARRAAGAWAWAGAAQPSGPPNQKQQHSKLASLAGSPAPAASPLSGTLTPLLLALPPHAHLQLPRPGGEPALAGPGGGAVRAEVPRFGSSHRRLAAGAASQGGGRAVHVRIPHRCVGPRGEQARLPGQLLLPPQRLGLLGVACAAAAAAALPAALPPLVRAPVASPTHVPQVPGFRRLLGKGLYTHGRYSCPGSLR